MAGNNTVKIDLQVASQGMDPAVQKSQTIKDNLTAAAGAMNKVAGGSTVGTAGSTGGTAGSKAVSQKAAGQEYAAQRGVAATTGASARNFAAESQSLGGLVRLYATVAANTYAAAAAFKVLSTAMDTTNMVKGLDQLGAASGIALGSLSKRLVEATDGAISLREAMETTTKAVSSGMNTDDVLRIGTLAKKASQALGLDMGDAISRLTRGITKLEPELLDELGIFTKLEPAIKQYANSVNKSVSELSDFERRAAFANAVLKEGEDKFNSIKLDANPYTKLAAEVSNAAQKILELVNKVLGPVAEFFSKSPTALITGIGALAAILLKQAVPAIGQFKQGLEDTTARAQQLAVTKAADALKARQLVDAQIVAAVEARADKELRAVEAAESKITQLQKSGLDKRSAAYKLLQKDLQDVSKADLTKVSTKADELEAKGKFKQAEAYREVVKAIEAQQKAEADLVATKQKLTAQEEKDRTSKKTTYGLINDAGSKAAEAATKSSIVTNAAYNGSLIGVTGAFRLMREEIEKNNIKGFSAAMLTAKGTVAAMIGSLSTVMSALNGVFMAIGIVSGVVAIMDGIFSKASQQLSDFSNAVDRTDKAASTLADTLALAYKTNPFSVQTLTAQSNAVVEFASSIDSLIDRTKKAQKALSDSWWDRFKNNIKDAFGFGIEDVFAETVAKDLSNVLSTLKTSPIRVEIEDEIKNLLKVKDVSNIEELEKALRRLDPAGETVKKLGLTITKAGNETKTASEKAKEFSDAFKKSEEAFKNLQKQFEIKTPLTEWTDAAISSLLKLQNNLSGPVEIAISNLIKLTDDVAKNPIFGSQSASVASFSEQLKASNQELITNEASLKGLREELEKLEAAKKSNNLIKMGQVTGTTGNVRSETEQALSGRITEINKLINRAEDSSAKARLSAGKAAAEIASKINSGLSEQVGKIATGISAELAKGANRVLENLYSRIDSVPEYAKKQQELKLKELESEAQLIRVNQELTNQSRLLAAEIAVSNTKGALDTAKKDLENAAPGQDKLLARSGLDKAQVDYSTATTKLSLLKKSVTDPVGALKQLQKEFGSSEVAAKAFAQEIASSARENLGYVKSLRDNAQQQRIIKEIESPLAEEDARLKGKLNTLNAEKTALDIKKQQLDLDIQQGSLGQIGSIEAAKELTIEQAKNAEKIKLAEIESKVVRNAIIASGLISEANKESNKEKREQALLEANTFIVSEAILRNSEEQAVKNATLLAGQTANFTVAKSLAELETARLKDIDLKITKEAEHSQNITKYENDVAKSRLENSRQELEYLANADLVSKEYAANRLAELATENQAIEYQSSIREAAAQRDAATRAALFTASLAQAQPGADPDAGMDAANKEIQRANEVYNARKLAIDAANVSASRSIELAKIQSLETAKQNQELDKQTQLLGLFTNIADTLASAFGKTGTALSTFVSALGDSVLTQEKYTTEREKLLKIENDYQSQVLSREGISPEDDAKRAKAAKDLGKLEEKNARDQMVNNTKLVGSVKNMFKEKTAAYRIFNAFEKAMHVYTLTMDIAKIASGWALTTQKVAQGTVQATAAAGPAGAEAAKDTPGPVWVKIAAGLAAFAFVSSLAKGGGGGGSAGPGPGMGAADRQETQGTGMSWLDGKKVENGGGVFGDATAKSESIVNSIEILNSNVVEGLESDNRMVTLLTNIDKNIGSAAKGLYNIPGVRVGSIANTKEGTTGSSGFLGIGAKSTTTTIIDSGLVLKGTFLELAKAGKDNIKTYEDVSKTVKRSGFLGIGGGTKTSISTNYGELDQKTLDQVSAVFQNATDLFIEVGEKLGQSQEEVLAGLSGVQVDKLASLRGLKGADLEKEFNSIISSILDDASGQIFKSMEKYRAFGEGMLQTTMRVVDGNAKVNAALSGLGLQLHDVEYVASATEESFFGLVKSTTYVAKDINKLGYDATEAMIKVAGGLDKFLENTKFFVDNFLTEAERMAPIAANVTTSMAKIVASAIKAGAIEPSTTGALDTNAEFKALYLTLSQSTTPAAIELRHQMDLIAPSFVKATAQYENLTKQVTEINNTAATQFMSETEKLAYTRAQERNEISETNRVLFDFITELKQKSQEVVKAGQDLVAGYNEAVSAADSAKAALLSTAKQGLGTLEASANSTKTELLNLAKQGLNLLEAEAASAKSELLNLAKQGLSLLEADAAAAKSELLDLAKQGLGLLETEASNAKSELLDLAKQGLNLLEAEAASAKSELLDLAKQGLGLLEADAANAKSELLDLANQGLGLLESAASDTKSKLLDLAQQGLDLLETKASDAKSELVSLATEGLGLLSTKLSGLENDLQSLNSNGFSLLKGTVTSIKDSIKQSYKTALENQKNATKALVDGLKTAGSGIKDFLKSVSVGDLAPDTNKAKRLQDQYKQTLAAAQAGDEKALSSLSQVAQDFLAAAQEQSSTKVDYARTFAEVTSELTSISTGVDTQVKSAEEIAAENMVNLGTETLSAADALKAANAELAKWTAALETAGLSVETNTEIANTEKLNSAQGALDALDTATKSLNTWLGLIGKDAADMLTKTDPKNLTELTAEFDSLKTKIAAVNVDIAAYISDTNTMLKNAGIGEADLLKANTTVTEATLKAQIAVAQDKLDSANTAVNNYIKNINVTLDAAGFGKTELLKPTTAITSDSVATEIAITQKKLSDANKAVDDYIKNTNLELEKAGFSKDDLLKPTTAITSDSVATEIATTQKKLSAANAAVDDYIKNINLELDKAGFGKDDLLKPTTAITSDSVATEIVTTQKKLSAANKAVDDYIKNINLELDKAGFGKDDLLKPTTAITSDTVATEIKATQGKLIDANAAVKAYIDSTNIILAAAGFGDAEKLKPTTAVTKDTVETEIKATQKKLSDANTAVKVYIDSTNIILAAAGFGDAEKLKPTTVITQGSVETEIKATQKKLNDANAAVTTYVLDINKTLTAAGFGDAEKLKPTKLIDSKTVKDEITATQIKLDAAIAAVNTYVLDTNKILITAGFSDAEKLKPTTVITQGSVETEIKATQAKLEKEKQLVKEYIESTNKVLTAAGYGDDNLLSATKTEEVNAAVTTANSKYLTAVNNVKTWANTLAGLGIAFNPYGGKATDLTTLAANFTTAQTAFDTLNTKINDYIAGVTSSLGKLTVPTAPKVPTTTTTVTTGTTATTTPPTNTAVHDQSNYYYNEYISAGTSEALGGVYNAGARLKFAQGGAFTNSLVNSRTMFNIGEMGEAGPEAIMPLTRGADGSLGVTAQLPNFGNRDEANRVLIAEIKELRNEVAKLRDVSLQNEYNTRKTKEVLQQVTVGGEYMQTKTVT